jgi:phospholipase C
MATSPLLSINNIVVLMLENRSFDHMLGFLYAANGNVSPTGAPFDGLTGNESNPDSSGNAVPVTQIQATDQTAYYMRARILEKDTRPQTRSCLVPRPLPRQPTRPTRDL